MTVDSPPPTCKEQTEAINRAESGQQRQGPVKDPTEGFGGASSLAKPESGDAGTFSRHPCLTMSVRSGGGGAGGSPAVSPSCHALSSGEGSAGLFWWSPSLDPSPGPASLPACCPPSAHFPVGPFPFLMSSVVLAWGPWLWTLRSSTAPQLCCPLCPPLPSLPLPGPHPHPGLPGTGPPV